MRSLASVSSVRVAKFEVHHVLLFEKDCLGIAFSGIQLLFDERTNARKDG